MFSLKLWNPASKPPIQGRKPVLYIYTYTLPSVRCIKRFMEEALSGIFLQVSCAAGINFKVKKKIKKISLRQVCIIFQLFPVEVGEWRYKQSCLPAWLKVPHHREPRNLSQKISSGTSGGGQVKGRSSEVSEAN